MKHLYHQHLTALHTSIRHLLKQPLISTLILIMLGLALALPFSLYLTTRAFETVYRQLTINPDITVFMQTQVTPKQIAHVEMLLKSNVKIKKVRYLSKEKALTETSTWLGQDDWNKLLDTNPLPDAFVLTPALSEPSAIQQLSLELQQLPGVKEVLLEAQWVQALYQIKKLLDIVLLTLAMSLSFAFILISHNIIQLQVLARRDEIEISHLLGASSSFIRRPFLYQAVWQGILTSVLGIALSSSVIFYLSGKIELILAPYNLPISRRLPTIPEVLGVIGLVILLSLAGAAWASRRFLNEIKLIER
ncbi:MAG: permease-like cell division protein FtsX [Neisseriaceae bacterium]